MKCSTAICRPLGILLALGTFVFARAWLGLPSGHPDDAQPSGSTQPSPVSALRPGRYQATYYDDLGLLHRASAEILDDGSFALHVTRYALLHAVTETAVGIYRPAQGVVELDWQDTWPNPPFPRTLSLRQLREGVLVLPLPAGTETQLVRFIHE